MSNVPAITVRVSLAEREVLKAAAARVMAEQVMNLPAKERDVQSLNTWCRKLLLAAARMTLGGEKFEQMLAEGNEQKLAEESC